MVYRVFVSHSSRDREWVEWIKGQTGPGIELWLAEHDPQPGRLITSKVQDQLNKCHAMIAFITEASQASPYVQQEIGWALKGGKTIVPLVQIGTSQSQLAMLQGVEYVPFDFQHPEDGRVALFARLQSLKQTKAANDELQTVLLLLGALVVIGIATS
jgi:hypothetical protein